MQPFGIYNTNLFCYFNVLSQLFLNMEDIQEIVQNEDKTNTMHRNFITDLYTEYEIEKDKVSRVSEKPPKIKNEDKKISFMNIQKRVVYRINKIRSFIKRNRKKIKKKYKSTKDKPNTPAINLDICYFKYCEIFKISPRKQQDCAEVLNNIFGNILSENLGHDFTPDEENITQLPDILKLSSSLIKTEIFCNFCKKTLYKNNEFNTMIYLDVTYSIKHSISKYLEYLPPHDVSCKCKNLFSWFKIRRKKTTIKKNKNIYHTKKFLYLPKYLFLTLNRYQNIRPFKNNQEVLINQYIKIETSVYEIYAIILHSGHQINRGHYTISIKNEHNKWKKYNDDKVRDIILNLSNRFVQKRCYILLYKKIQ
ncbi:Ubiquitin carboxyl-terminal hydrolase [Spraguea lophii 42_110]|uniref:Ubiquitin carboxyl-terminal hydrolase n=1 Tax=Spraguea lophii (strain 42_110) TaxID=1358809 RepID=S7W9K1_SPRLO|nr:Ubiquitin carboxyl-terminal hydrolase [Spraguea lophii 42_110]